MSNFFDQQTKLRVLLNQQGYDLRLARAAVADTHAADVLIKFPHDIFPGRSVIVVPDAHIGDGSSSDIFLNGDPHNVTRLSATLRAIRQYLRDEGANATLLQIGDWYDVWRAIGKDATAAEYAVIENVPAYQELLGLDAELSMAHAIGNHDASFTHALPNKRVSQRDRFLFGFSLEHGRVFALHGHQVDSIQGAPNESFDITAVYLGSIAAKYLGSQFRNLQHFIDTQGNMAGIRDWLVGLLAVSRPDPTPEPRERQADPPHGDFQADFIAREDMDKLVRVAVAALDARGSHSADLELVLIGHSHKACVGWTPHPVTHKPVIVADSGSWVYGEAQILFGAYDHLCVYDIVPNPVPHARTATAPARPPA